MKQIKNNILLLYIVFILMCINMVYLLKIKDYQSILLFSFSCLLIYLINQNMIVVLGVSLIVINIIRLRRENVEVEVEVEVEKNTNTNTNEEKEEYESFNESFDNSDELREKLKRISPNIIYSLNENPINKMNNYLNSMSNFIDP
jgi:hypothetical protein